MENTGTRILVDEWNSPATAALHYAKTPVWKNVARGQSAHIGYGVWLTRCRECDDYTETYGSMPVYATIGPHEVAAHSLSVPGINVGLLPDAAVKPSVGVLDEGSPAYILSSNREECTPVTVLTIDTVAKTITVRDDNIHDGEAFGMTLTFNSSTGLMYLPDDYPDPAPLLVSAFDPRVVSIRRSRVEAE